PYASAALVSRSLRVHRFPAPRSRRWPTPLLAGQDGGSPKSDLPDEASGIFLCGRLDGWNRAEIAEEISVSAQTAVCPLSRLRGRVGVGVSPHHALVEWIEFPHPPRACARVDLPRKRERCNEPAAIVVHPFGGASGCTISLN